MAVLRWLLIGVGVLLVLLIGAIAGALLLVDTRAIQDTIAEQVEQRTGRALDFEGELSLSFFPWLGFELGETRLANAEGFEDDGPFARIGTTELRLEVLPLLRRQVVVDTIRLHGLQLNLGVAEDGRGNWADIEAALAAAEADTEAGAPDDEPDEPSEPSAETADEPLDLPFDFRVGGFELAGATLNWRDRQADTRISVSNVDLTTGPLALDEATPVTLDVAVELDDGLAVELALRTQARATLAPLFVELRDLAVDVEAHGPDLPADGVSARLEAGLAADLDAGTATVEPLRIGLLDTVDGSGRAEVAFGGEVPGFTGRMDFASFNPRTLARRMDIELPPMADSDALSAFAFGFAFRGDPGEVMVDDIDVRLDDTRMQGQLTALMQEVPRINARFGVDAIDLDRYLPEGDDDETAEQPDDDGAEPGEDPIASIPLEAFHAVNADARLRIDRLGFAGLDARAAVVGLVLEDGLLTLEEMRADIADGRIALNGRFDARGDTPATALSMQIESLQAEPLLGVFLDRSPLTGRVDSELSLATGGGDLDAWLAALDGDIAAAFDDGVLRGFDIEQALRNASARLRGQAEEDVEETRTPFSTLRASATIRDGVLRTTALDLQGEGVSASGDGAVNLGARSIDYLASLTVDEALLGDEVADDQRLRGLTIPVRIRGELFSPEVDIDLTSALRARARGEAEAAREEAEREAREAVEREREAAREEARRERREAEEELERERDKASEELEERARDLLGQ